MRMDGWDMMEVEVYKEEKVQWKRHQDTSIKKEKKYKKNTERREWTMPFFCIALTSSG